MVGLDASSDFVGFRLVLVCGLVAFLYIVILLLGFPMDRLGFLFPWFAFGVGIDLRVLG